MSERALERDVPAPFLLALRARHLAIAPIRLYVTDVRAADFIERRQSI
jgi:hypothetical protein